MNELGKDVNKAKQQLNKANKKKNNQANITTAQSVCLFYNTILCFFVCLLDEITL
jgi:hypothetical protein